MKFLEFYKLWDSAQSAHTKFDYLVKYDQQYAEAGIIYDMANGGMKTIRALTGLSQRNFASTYGISQYTYVTWETGTRTPPKYVLVFCGYAVLSDFVQANHGNGIGG